jgi:hypothetical protein
LPDKPQAADISYEIQLDVSVHVHLPQLASIVCDFCPGIVQFLTGLWGMNFDPDMGNMPELNWEYGYVMFW